MVSVVVQRRGADGEVFSSAFAIQIILLVNPTGLHVFEFEMIELRVQTQIYFICNLALDIDFGTRESLPQVIFVRLERVVANAIEIKSPIAVAQCCNDVVLVVFGPNVSAEFYVFLLFGSQGCGAWKVGGAALWVVLTDKKTICRSKPVLQASFLRITDRKSVV